MERRRIWEEKMTPCKKRRKKREKEKMKMERKSKKQVR